LDADKAGYLKYLEWAIENLRIGGVVAAHNAFSGGGIVDPHDHDEITLTIRNFNVHMAREPRLVSTIFPAGDGTDIGVKIY
jgi:caffeoyl-CoA O-methyltransferase